MVGDGDGFGGGFTVEGCMVGNAGGIGCGEPEEICDATGDGSRPVRFGSPLAEPPVPGIPQAVNINIEVPPRMPEIFARMPGMTPPDRIHNSALRPVCSGTALHARLMIQVSNEPWPFGDVDWQKRPPTADLMRAPATN